MQALQFMHMSVNLLTRDVSDSTKSAAQGPKSSAGLNACREDGRVVKIDMNRIPRRCGARDNARLAILNTATTTICGDPMVCTDSFCRQCVACHEHAGQMGALVRQWLTQPETGPVERTPPEGLLRDGRSGGAAPRRLAHPQAAEVNDRAVRAGAECAKHVGRLGQHLRLARADQHVPVGQRGPGGGLRGCGVPTLDRHQTARRRQRSRDRGYGLEL